MLKCPYSPSLYQSYGYFCLSLAGCGFRGLAFGSIGNLGLRVLKTPVRPPVAHARSGPV
jgi:hypothetical protein